MSKDVDTPRRGQQRAAMEPQMASQDLTITAAVEAYAKALDEYPECLQGQQRHFAVTVPALQRQLLEVIERELGERERKLLADALHDIDGDPLEDRAADWGPDEDWL